MIYSIAKGFTITLKVDLDHSIYLENNTNRCIRMCTNSLRNVVVYTATHEPTVTCSHGVIAAVREARSRFDR